MVRTGARFADRQDGAHAPRNDGHDARRGFRRKFLEIKLAPAQLAEALPKDSDLDQDGIPYVREYLDGTHPVNRNDGNPWLLFKYNFQKNLPQIALALLATIAGMWGLSHLLHGFAAATRLKEETAEESEA